MDTWFAVGLTEMVRLMFDDPRDNARINYLEALLELQAAEIAKLEVEVRELEVDIDEALTNLEGAERYIDRMHKLFEKQAAEHIMTDLAINIQAAEAEFRADEEKRKRLQLLMRR